MSIDREPARRARGRGPSARLFFALVPDAAARDALAVLAQDVAQAVGGRASRAQTLHVTLAFLGNVPLAQLDALQAIGAHAAAAAAPFVLTLDALGAFRAAGVAWAGTEAVPAALEQVFAALRELLDAGGLPTERRAFHPHVTLARRCARPLPRRGMAPVAWPVDALVLMASDTLPEGPRYRRLASWPLAGATSLP